jgi:hypothetical protein
VTFGIIWTKGNTITRVMNRKEVKLNTLRQLRELVQSDMSKVGPVMDDYDGGQMAAYEQVIKSIDVFEAIINHTS